MRKILVLVAMAAGACQSEVPQTSDAHVSGGDAGVSVGDVTCQTHTFTTMLPNGTKIVTDQRFAIVAGVAPGDDFWIETCDQVEIVNGVTIYAFTIPFDAPCPAGSTCTATGTPLPTGAHGCSWSRGGTFIDSKLYVTCGSKTTQYNSGGTTTDVTEVTAGAIRIHR